MLVAISSSVVTYLEIPSFDRVDRTYDGLRQALAELESRYSPAHLAEGIVFHHPDGRRANECGRRQFCWHAASRPKMLRM